MINNTLVLEGSRDNLLLPYLNQVQQVDPKATLSMLKQYLLRKFVNEGGIGNLSLGSNFYLAGVARYYFNGDLTTNQKLSVFDENVKDEFISDVCQKLNALIAVLRGKYIDSVGETWEQPEDFGTLSITQLLKKYKKPIEKILGVGKEKEAELPSQGQGSDSYSYDIMYNFGDCTKYKDDTSPGSWCITYAEQHYRHYTSQMNGHFVIFLRNGYENEPREVGQNYPLDSYGTSMLAILQSNNDPSILQVTSRWNHGGQDSPNISYSQADHVINGNSEFTKLTRVDQAKLTEIFNAWKANKGKVGKNAEEKAITKEAIQLLKYKQILVNSGQDPLAVFNGLIVNANYYVNTDSEDLSKAFRKSICAVGVRVGESKFVSFSYKGKIYYDYLVKVYEFDRNFLPVIRYVDEDKSLIKLNTQVNKSGKSMFFSLKRKTFIEADGIKKFSGIYELSKIDNANLAFFNINRTANVLFDKNTHMPITLPNGRHIVEQIDEIGDTMLRIVADSAAFDEYILYVPTMTFRDSSKETGGKEIVNLQYKDYFLTMPRTVSYYASKTVEIHDRKGLIAIDGHMHFTTPIKNKNNSPILGVRIGNDIHFANLDTREFIKYNGKDIVGGYGATIMFLKSTNDCTLYRLTPMRLEGENGAMSVIYDTVSKKVLTHKGEIDLVVHAYQPTMTFFSSNTGEYITLDDLLNENNPKQSFNKNLNHKSKLI